MTALDMLLERVKGSKAFKRNKVPIESKVIAALLYFSGLQEGI